MAVRVYTPGWDITVIAKMPQKGITMKMNVGVILWQQLAFPSREVPRDYWRVLLPCTGSWMIIREQDAAVVYYLCAMRGHTSVNCPRLISGGPQNEMEHMGNWYWSPVNMRNLPRLYKTRKKPLLDPGATMNQQGGTCCSTSIESSEEAKLEKCTKAQHQLARQQVKQRGGC